MTTSQVNKRGSLATDPIRNFRFLAKFYPLTEQADNTWTPDVTVGFTSVSGLSIATESIPYREGSYNTTVHQVPGQSTFSPVTFQRGVVLGTRQHWDWMRMLFDVNGGGRISATRSFRANIEVSVLAHPVRYSTPTGGSTYGTGATSPGSPATDDTVVARFMVYNAWPTSVAYSDLSAGDNALMVEQLTVVHEGFDMEWGTWSESEGIVSAPTF
jgi:phage tail-like protein